MKRISQLIFGFVIGCFAGSLLSVQPLQAQDPECCHTRTVELDTIEKIFSDWTNGPPPFGGFEDDIEEVTVWPATRQELCDLISVPPAPPALTATLKVSLNVTLPDADPAFPNRIKDGDRIVATATFNNLGAGKLTQYHMYLTLGPDVEDTETITNYYESGSTATLTFTEYFDFDVDTRISDDGQYRLLEVRAWGDGELGADDRIEIKGIYHCLIAQANPPGPITNVVPLPPGCAKCGNQRPCTTAGASTVCATPELIEHGTALDYGVVNVPGSSGCSSCGGAVGGLGNVPNSLILERRMIPANQVTIGNSSPGMYFMDMDMRLDLYEGNSPSQNVAIFFDPNCERSVFMTDSGATGIYAPDTPGSAYVGDLTLYDGSGNVTADVDLAETAKITSHDGWVYLFDIVAGHIDCFHRGGCIKTITSPDGFVKTFGYKTFTPTEIDDDPTLQYQVDSITDPSGNTAEISYHPLQQASRWVISDIDVNDGEVLLEYDYNASGHLETVKRNGVKISEYTYGTDTEWDAAYITWDHLLWNNAQARDTIYISSDYLLWEGELVNQFADNLVGRADGSGYRYMSVSQHPSTAGLYRVEYRGQLIEWQAGVSWRYFESWSSSGPGYNGYSGTLEDSVNNMAFAHHYDVEPTNYLLGQPEHLTDETGLTFTASYDNQGNLYRKVYDGAASGDYEQWLYDSNNQVTYYRDRTGFVTLTERDSRGLVVRVTKGHKDTDGDGNSTAEPEAIQTIFGYYDSGHANAGMLKWTATNAWAAGPVVEPAANRRTDYEYGARNQLVKVTRPLPVGQTVRPFVSYAWVNGQVSTMTDEVSNITTYTYDPVDRVTKILYPDGSDQQTWYDDANYQLYQKNRNDVVDMVIRDDVGRVSRTWGAMGTDSNILDNHVATQNPGYLRKRVDNYYLAGRVQPRKVKRDGITNETDYDYRGRATVSRRYASMYNAVIVTSTQTWVNNLLLSSSESYPGYSRTTYNGYSADRFTVRKISTSNPSVTFADNTAVLNALRVTGLDPDHVIADAVRDLRGNLVQVIDGYGTITMNTFDSMSRQTQTVRGHGLSLALTSMTEYNDQGRVEKTTDPAGMETFTEYDDAGNVKTRTDGYGTSLALATSYTYDPRGRQKTVTSPTGAVNTSHYNDCCGNLAASEDAYGDGSIRVANAGGQSVYQATVKDFDFATGNYFDPPASETLSETTSRYYDAGQVHYTTRWKSARSQIDPENPPIAGVDSVPVADGLTTQYVYFRGISPNAGWSTQTITRLGSAGTAVIDMNPVLDQLQLAPASGGASLQFVNGAYSNSLATATVVISPDEKTMQVSVTDGLGRGVMNAMMTGPAATTPNELITWSCMQHDQSYTLTGFGDVQRVNQIDRNGNMSSSLSDGFGWNVGSLDANSKLTRTKFDPAGNAGERIDANSNTVTYVYDALGRNTSTTNFAGTTSTTYNNTNGRVDSRTDAKSNTTSFTYDILGRQTIVTDRLSQDTVRVYDSAGRLSTLTDAQSMTTTYTYDLLGRKLTTTYPDGSVVTNDYDPSGTFPTGSRAQKMTYDSGKSRTSIASFNGTLDKIEYRDSGGTLIGSDDFTYDDQLRRSGSTSLDGVVRALAYNDHGQLASDTTTYDSQSYTVSYGYDNQLRQNEITYPSGRKAAYTFTDRNELDTISWDSTQIEDRLYDDGGRLTNVDRAYTDEIRTYDAANRMSSIANTGVGTASYTWDANSNKLGETWTGNMASWSFTTEKPGGTFTDGYDAEDRFRRFIQTSQSSDNYLDRSAIGNITDVNDGTAHLRSYSNAHELTSVDGTSQTFDNDGNLTLTHTGVTLNWDVGNRLTQTIVPSTATAGIEGTNDYGYDSDGKRVFKKITRNSTVVKHTVFIHAGPNCIAEYTSGTAASSPDQEYVYGQDIDSLVMLVRNNNADKSVVTRNQQWSITALVDASDGTVQERYTYDHFGKRTILAPDGSTIRTLSSYNNPYGYTSRRHDDESALIYFRARYYDSTTGEFTSRDPLEYVDGMSMMRAYIGFDKIDSTGQCQVKLSCTTLLSNGIAGAQHCGLEVHHANGTVHKWHVHSPGAGILSDDTCDIQPTEIETPIGAVIGQRYRIIDTWTDMSGRLCNCIDRLVREINRRRFRYKPIPSNYLKYYRSDEKCYSRYTCNSNYVTSCMMHKCGIRSDGIRTGGGLTGVFTPGWGHRMQKCLNPTYKVAVGSGLAGSGSCGCVCEGDRWETIDDRWCSAPPASPTIWPDWEVVK